MPNSPLIQMPTCTIRDECPVSGSCAPERSALCDTLDRHHESKLAICSELEAIADSLPGAVDRHACLRVAASLLPVMRTAQAYEEQVVFPAFMAGSGSPESLRRLRVEHIEDESLGEELTEGLLRIGHGGAVQNPEAFGFMLRAFFETVRRHIAFEREHVMPIVQRTWTTEQGGKA